MTKSRTAATQRPTVSREAIETCDAIAHLEDVRLAYMATEILAAPCASGVEAKRLDIDREQLGALLNILNCSLSERLRAAREAAYTSAQFH